MDFILANYIMVHDGEMGFLATIYKYACSTTPSLLKPKRAETDKVEGQGGAIQTHPNN